MNTESTTTFTLERDAAGILTFIDASGKRHEKAKPVRLFPLTEPDSWICIVDSTGSELACIEHIGELPADTRSTLLAALANHDFVPVIRSISSVMRAPNGHKWTVVTDRGPTVFQTESDESIQQLGSSRLVVIDHHNTRYLIPDINTLDSKSRQRLERYY